MRRMVLRLFAVMLILGGCATATANQGNAQSDASVFVDSGGGPADGANASAQQDAPTVVPPDAVVVEPDASSGSGSGINGTCSHAICSTGTSLQTSCSSCTTEICTSDPYCCDTKWDAQCVDEVSSICSDTCP
jgi:hypothetical protein